MLGVVGEGLLEDLRGGGRGGARVQALPDGAVPDGEGRGADLDGEDGGGGAEGEGVVVAEGVGGAGGEGGAR